MARCRLCGLEERTVSERLGFCGRCLTERFAEIAEEIQKVHAQVRAPFGLPPSPPRTPNGLTCERCQNVCRLGQSQVGYCGLRKNEGGVLVGGDEETARVSWYHDPLPTNCVADWVCAGGTAAGYPAFSRKPGPERGFFNLAVFYRACSFDCLFCQNWRFKRETWLEPAVTAEQLAGAAGGRTSCICYFGGDPSPQIVHSLAAARLAREVRRGQPLRICWETNGSVHPSYLAQMVELALESGGCLKFDLKAFSPGLHQGLCGVSNERTLANFAAVAAHFDRRPDPPLLVAATLLIPGYISREEMGRLARFIAAINPEIPYALLAFHPDFYLDDLPATSAQHAREALEAASAAGLKKVRLGNLHLLGQGY